MSITWLKKTIEYGIANLNLNSLTLNTNASAYFDDAYRFLIGIDENKNIIIKGLNRNEYELGKHDKDTIFEFQKAKTYTRISSKTLMSNISDYCNIKLDKENKKFKTFYDYNENNLVILLNEKEN